MRSLGHCILCDMPCFEVRATFPDGSPRKLGPPFEGARQWTLVFMDGSRGTATTCADCAVTPETLPRIHAHMREANATESKNEDRAMRLGRLLTLREQWIHGKVHLDFVHNPPLGVLAVELWTERMAREAQKR